MKLQYKLYIGLTAILGILLIIGGLILAQEGQKREATERLMTLYRPAQASAEGLVTAFSQFNSGVTSGLNPSVDDPSKVMVQSIQLFNEHLGQLSSLTQLIPFKQSFSIEAIDQQFDEVSFLGLSVVNQYRELIQQQRVLEGQVESLIAQLGSVSGQRYPDTLLMQRDLLKLSLFIASPLHRSELYDANRLLQLENQLVKRIKAIQADSELSYLLDMTEMGYGLGEVRTLYARIINVFNTFYVKRNQYEQAQQRMQQLLEAANKVVNSNGAQALNQLQAITKNSTHIEYVLIPLGIIIAGLLAYQTASRIRKPLEQLLEATRFAQQGDFSYRIEIESSDEVARLAHHFNEMMDRLGSITVSRSYLQQVLDTVLHAVIVVDDDFKMKFINTTAATYFPNKAQVGASIFNCRTDEGAFLLNEPDRCLLREKGELLGLEKPIRLVSGQRLIVAMNVARLSLNESQHWVITLHDITAIKNAQRSLNLYAKIFETSNDAIVISNKHNVIEQVNPAFTQITGYSADDVVNQNPNILSSGKQDRDFYKKMWGELLMYGRWQGEIWNRRKSGEAYAEWLSIVAIHNEYGLIERFVGVFSDITQRKEAEQLIHRQANYDALTELPNRRLFWDRLAQALLQSDASQQGVALLYVDLDGFKPVNDTYGHEYGDLLLKHVADNLKALVKNTDTVARLGGDEFAILLPAFDRDKLEGLAGKIVHDLMQPIEIKGKQIYIGASVGISTYPDIAQSQEQLIHQADSAMYYVKAANKNNYAVYDEQMELLASQRMQLEQDLNSAVDNQQLEVIFQPMFDVKSNRIVCAEALLRWQHPEKGQIMPDVFIPIAEESGLIQHIGHWVLREVCRLAVLQMSEVGFVKVAVNISPKQFMQPDFVSGLAQILNETGFPAEYLELEITERLIFDELAATSVVMQKLADLGVSIAIDDFGIGYATLNDLKRFPVKELKFDRSFIKEIRRSHDDQTMIRALADMAHQMGMKVVAEGVEDLPSLDLLKAAGCDLVQGFVYHEAMSMTSLVRLLDQQNTQPNSNNKHPSA